MYTYACKNITYARSNFCSPCLSSVDYGNTEQPSKHQKCQPGEVGDYTKEEEDGCIVMNRPGTLRKSLGDKR